MSVRKSRKKDIFLPVVFLMAVILAALAFSRNDAASPDPGNPALEPGGGTVLPDPGETATPGVTRQTRLLRPGTDWETTLHIITAPEEGPMVMVMGGVHGDEIAGYLAADIVATWSIDRGTLLVLPRANTPAVKTNTRYIPGSCDLNYIFPGNAAGNPSERLAAAIYAVMAEYRPVWVVDLHEAWEFERVRHGQLGQTIIYPPDAPSLPVVQQIVAGLNSSITESIHKYQVLRGGVRGGTIRASRSLGLESFTIETTRKLPLEVRVEQHLQAVRLLLTILEVNVLD